MRKLAWFAGAFSAAVFLAVSWVLFRWTGTPRREDLRWARGLLRRRK